MTHERIFSVDSEGSTEQTGQDKQETFPNGTRIVLDNGENKIPIGRGESVVTSPGGKNFLVRPSEHRVYDVESNIWHNLPEGVEPRDFIDGL